MEKEILKSFLSNGIEAKNDMSIKPKSSRQDYEDLMFEISLGNRDAYNFLLSIGNIFEKWDGLYDKDVEYSSHEINNVFSDMCFELSRNRFFVENRSVFESFIFLAWNAWMDSMELKDSEIKIEKLFAWVRRDFCNDIDALVSWIIGGKEHARNMWNKCRRFYLKHRLETKGIKEIE